LRTKACRKILIFNNHSQEYVNVLRNLTVHNFRAYRHESFDFSKINIFMGPNNSGKSSALSAINLLAQTAQNYRTLSSPLLLNGQFEQLGTFLDVAHGNTSRAAIGFDFSIRDIDVSVEVKYRPQRREMFVSRFSLARSDKPVYSFVERRDSFAIKYSGRTSESLGPRAHRRPGFAGYWPQQRFFSFLSLEEQQDPDSKMREFYQRFSREMRTSERQVIETLSAVDSLSPFREQPQRTYIYTGEAPDHIGRTGSNGVSMLVNDEGRRGSHRSGLIQEIDHWLQVTGIAKGIRVKNLTPRHFEMCIIDHAGKEHNICDVGFGCSQVMPVLAGGLHSLVRRRGLGNEAPIYVVQEPEIHLHPNAQAALGSFFVGLANEGTQVFIETHSDHLVLRVARHVARGELSPDDVAIYFVDSASGEREVQRIGFSDDGTFSPDWPGGFFPQRKAESLALARDRLATEASTSASRFPYL
jgi:predicted ATPase